MTATIRRKTRRRRRKKMKTKTSTWRKLTRAGRCWRKISRGEMEVGSYPLWLLNSYI